jgi:hypothetical protein
LRRRASRGSERHGLGGDTEAAAAHPAVAHDPGRDIGGRIDADREADLLRSADHCRVDADDAAVAVDERAA